MDQKTFRNLFSLRQTIQQTEMIVFKFEDIMQKKCPIKKKIIICRLEGHCDLHNLIQISQIIQVLFTLSNFKDK